MSLVLVVRTVSGDTVSLILLWSPHARTATATDSFVWVGGSADARDGAVFSCFVFAAMWFSRRAIFFAAGGLLLSTVRAWTGAVKLNAVAVELPQFLLRLLLNSWCSPEWRCGAAYVDCNHSNLAVVVLA